MSSQIQITGETKVKSLTGVLVGTTGVVSSLNIDGSLGIPQLDVNGKILVSQLPNSVMEYKGTWNAATNTPTLVNGTGNQGDVYLCNVAGTVNFGAGAIAFFVGDQVIYSGSIWQRASGATGTVTSVAVTESGDSLNITGSPITTSGTINIGFNGTNLQYVNGAGNLTTFPTLITSIGLSMPSAFSVANSPLTANGTIAVTGAGVASQYIRGDGTLADFPSSGGGGSSVSYYLNGGTSQGTIGGTTYYEMSKTAVIGTGVDFAKSGDGFIVAFLTDANDPAQLNIPAGNWNYEIYASMSSNGGTPQMYAELYKYDGTTFTLIATSSNEIIYDGTALNLYTFAMAVPATSLTLTDRLAVKLYATNSGGKTTTIHTQDGHLCQIITTFSTGITALNGLTAQVQYFQTGTSGTDFNISSATATHTFNIPDASATARGLITTGTQTIAGTKTFSDATKNNGGIFLQNGSSGSTTGYMNFGGSLNGVRFTNDLGISNNFTLPSATGYTFTFPNATGTLALTTDLGAYLPLAGGTLTGALGGTSASFSSSVTANGTLNIQRASGGATTTLQFKNEAGANRAKIVFGGSVEELGFYAGDGSTVNLTIASGGASIFSSSVTATSFVKTSGTSSQFLKADGSVDSSTYLTTSAAASTYLPLAGGTLTGNLGFAQPVGLLYANGQYIKDNGSGGLFIYSAAAINITSTSLTNNSNTVLDSSNYNSYALPLTGGTLTGALNINVSSGTAMNVAGNAIFRGDTGVGTPRQLIITSGGSTPVYLEAKGYGANYQTDFGIRTFNSAGTSFEVFYATSSGLVGINQTSPAYLLDVNGTFGATSAFLSSYIRTDGSAGFKNTSSGGTAPSALASYSQLFFDSYSLMVRKADGQINTFRYPSTASSQTWDFNVEGYLTAQSTASLTTGSVMFANSVGKITQDNAQFFWDDTNNRLGIGTASPSQILHLSGASIRPQIQGTSNSGYSSLRFVGLDNVGTSSTFEIGLNISQQNVFQITNGSSSFLNIATTGVATFNYSVTAANLILNGTATTALDLTSGTFSYALDFQNNDFIRQKNVAGTLGLILGMSTDDNLYVRGFSGINLQVNNGTTALALTSAGNVLIGTTTALQSTERLAVTSATNTAIIAQYTGGSTNGWAAKFWNNGTTGDNLFIEFVTETSITARGSVTFNRGAGITVYNTTSDYRLKTEISDFNALNIINNIKPKEFRIGDAENKSIGFIAHELQEYLPQAVTGKKDAIDKDGNPIYQGVDYSQLTGLLVKSVQELKIEIEQLKQLINK